MKIIDCLQTDPRWWESRCGIPTASNAARIFACATGRLSDGMDGYIAELVRDRQMQLPTYFSAVAGKPSTPAMRRGVDLEPVARAWYAERVAPLSVYQVGFCLTDDGRAGCSPDALIGEEAGLELKCYEEKTHLKWLNKPNELPATFAAQVHFSLLVTGRDYWTWCGWHPDHPAVVVRVAPDETTRKLGVALEIFHERLEKAIRKAGL